MDKRTSELKSHWPLSRFQNCSWKEFTQHAHIVVISPFRFMVQKPRFFVHMEEPDTDYDQTALLSRIRLVKPLNQLGTHLVWPSIVNLIWFSDIQSLELSATAHERITLI